MTADILTPTCQNCDHYRHNIEKRGQYLRPRHWCELTVHRVSPFTKGCPLHKYAPRYRLKGARNVTQQTRHPET